MCMAWDLGIEEPENVPGNSLPSRQLLTEHWKEEEHRLISQIHFFFNRSNFYFDAQYEKQTFKSSESYGK